jgi:glycosyltransferase involved in cell wall biosynthesis
MIKVLVLSKYDKKAASARQRFFQFADLFVEQGIQLKFSPFFCDDYLRERFSTGKAKPWSVVSAISRRLYSVLTATKFDFVIVHCELIPYCPAWIERILLSRVSYIYDYDDAIFHQYDEHKWSIVKFLLGNKISRVIAGAKAVMAGSQYLAEYAIQYNNTVKLIPTVVDFARYKGDLEVIPLKPFTVGWIGSPSTTEYLVEVSEPLRKLAAEGQIRLIAIGAKNFSIVGVDVEIRAWSEDKEVQDLMECDVGIMPLPDKNWAKGKCAFKLIQYMACGLPVIASPVGANNYVVTDGAGLLAIGQHEWVEALQKLRDDSVLRRTMGCAGRAVVAAKYSKNSVAPVIIELIRSLHKENSQCGV